MNIVGFLDKAQEKLEYHLTVKKAKKYIKRNKQRTFKSEILDWLSSLLFAVVVVFFVSLYFVQLFVIPSASMQDTLLIGDRVGVYKRAYGTELCAFGPKTGAKTANRGDIVIFYNPEYESKGIIRENLSNALFLMTLSLYNPSKEEKLFVKRAIGLPGDSVRFENGNVKIKPFSGLEYLDEDNVALGYNPIRDTEVGLDNYTYFQNIIKRELANNPSDTNVLSDYNMCQNGIYVKERHILPLGDNRDNSHDGRYFGPVDMSSVIGRGVFRFWPISEFRVF